MQNAIKTYAFNANNKQNMHLFSPGTFLMILGLSWSSVRLKLQISRTESDLVYHCACSGHQSKSSSMYRKDAVPAAKNGRCLSNPLPWHLWLAERHSTQAQRLQRSGNIRIDTFADIPLFIWFRLANIVMTGSGTASLPLARQSLHFCCKLAIAGSLHKSSENCQMRPNSKVRISGTGTNCRWSSNFRKLRVRLKVDNGWVNAVSVQGFIDCAKPPQPRNVQYGVPRIRKAELVSCRMRSPVLLTFHGHHILHAVWMCKH